MASYMVENPQQLDNIISNAEFGLRMDELRSLIIGDYQRLKIGFKAELGQFPS